MSSAQSGAVELLHAAWRFERSTKERAALRSLSPPQADPHPHPPKPPARYNPAQLRWERDDRNADLSVDDTKTVIKPKTGEAYQVGFRRVIIPMHRPPRLMSGGDRSAAAVQPRIRSRSCTRARTKHTPNTHAKHATRRGPSSTPSSKTPASSRCRSRRPPR